MNKGMKVRNITWVWNRGSRGRSGQRWVGQPQPKKAREELELDAVKRILNSRAGWCFMQTYSEIQLQVMNDTINTIVFESGLGE